MNIYSGQIIDDKTVNPDKAVKSGMEQLTEYESQWPSRFHDRLVRKIKPMSKAATIKSKDKDETPAMDTEMIYAPVITIMASSRESISTNTLFSYELSRYPSSLFDEKGEIRSTTKSVLKTKIKVECSQRNKPSPELLTDVLYCGLSHGLHLQQRCRRSSLLQ